MTDTTKQMMNDALNNGEIVFWTDPGHGWLQVPRPLIAEMKKEGMKVSGYSYADSNFFYLEEDCDASAFCACFPWINFSQEYRVAQKYSESIFIRQLNHVKV